MVMVRQAHDICHPADPEPYSRSVTVVDSKRFPIPRVRQRDPLRHLFERDGSVQVVSEDIHMQNTSRISSRPPGLANDLEGLGTWSTPQDTSS